MWADNTITEKRRMIACLQSYFVHSVEGHFIKEIVEIITQGRYWIRDFHELIDAHKYGYNPSDIPDRHQLSENVFLKLLKSRLIEPVPWVNCYDPIWIAYTFRDVELTWMLLKYNVGCVRKMEDIPKLKLLIPVMEKYLQLNTPDELQDFLDKLSDYPDKSLRRLKVVVWGLHSICYRKFPSFRRDKVMCLKTFFAFIPEPYVSSAEIGGVVKHIIGNQDGSDDFVSEVCQIFEEYYPESAKPYQPRSLKHLSCCCILQNLRRVGLLPQGVDQLSLPQVLKDYILPKKCPFLPESFYTEKENLLEDDDLSSSEELHSDSEDEFHSHDESLSEEDSEFSEMDVDHSRKLKINLRTRKFSILKRTQFQRVTSNYE